MEPLHLIALIVNLIMNINYIGLILSTTSFIIETLYEDKKQCFYIKGGDDIQLTSESLSFKDYIEEKLYTVNNDFLFLSVYAKDDVIPSFVDCANYQAYVDARKEEIISNNSKFLDLFDEVKSYYSNIEPTEESVYALKMKYKN